MHAFTVDTVENLPALHSPHELAPCSMPVFVIEPASHSSHDVLPALREYLPARQSLHASTADAEYWPAAHAVHVVAPVVLPVFVIQPASHSAHDESVDALDHSPAAQALHFVAPD